MPNSKQPSLVSDGSGALVEFQVTVEPQVPVHGQGIVQIVQEILPDGVGVGVGVLVKVGVGVLVFVGVGVLVLVGVGVGVLVLVGVGEGVITVRGEESELHGFPGTLPPDVYFAYTWDDIVVLPALGQFAREV